MNHLSLFSLFLLFIAGCAQPLSPPDEIAQLPPQPAIVEIPLETRFLPLAVVPILSLENTSHIVIQGAVESVPGFMFVDRASGSQTWVPLSNFSAIFSPIGDARGARIVLAFQGLLLSRQQTVGTLDWSNGEVSIDDGLPARLEHEATGLVLLDHPYLTTSSRNLPVGRQFLWRQNGSEWVELPHPEPVRFANPASMQTDDKALFICDDRSDGSLVVYELNSKAQVAKSTQLVGAQDPMGLAAIPRCVGGMTEAGTPAFSWLQFTGFSPGQTFAARITDGNWAVEAVTAGFDPAFLFAGDNVTFLAGNPWDDNSHRQFLQAGNDEWLQCALSWETADARSAVIQQGDSTDIVTLENQNVLRIAPLRVALTCPM